MAHKKQQQQHGKVHPQQTTRTASKHGRVNPKWKDKSKNKAGSHRDGGEGRRGGNVVETMVKQQVEVEKKNTSARYILFASGSLPWSKGLHSHAFVACLVCSSSSAGGRFDRFTQCRGFLPSCLIKFYANKRLVPSKKDDDMIWWLRRFSSSRVYARRRNSSFLLLAAAAWSAATK